MIIIIIIIIIMVKVIFVIIIINSRNKKLELYSGLLLVHTDEELMKANEKKT